MDTLLQFIESPNKFPALKTETLPFLFENNHLAKVQWSMKLSFFEGQLNSQIEQIEKDLNKTNLLASSQKRLEKTLASLQAHKSEVMSLLNEVGIFGTNNPSLKELLHNRIPSKQHLGSYFNNIFRDWTNSGDEENAAYLKLLDKLPNEPNNVLVLGGGAGRFSYDLARKFNKATIIQLDINPLLSHVGQKLCSGESMALTEISSDPLSFNDISKRRSLQAPSGNIDNLFYAIGDVSHLPFKKDSFDLIITPWLIDIIPEEFSQFSARCNQLLSKKGLWLNYGPLSFEGQRPIHKLLSEDVLEQLGANCFTNRESGSIDVPYLTSSIHSQKRSEKIFWFLAEKEKACKAPAAFHYYPEWLKDPHSKVPLEQTNITHLFHQKNLEANIMGQLIQNQTLQRLIDIIAQQSKANPAEAEAMILGTVSRMIESNELVFSK